MKDKNKLERILLNTHIFTNKEKKKLLNLITELNPCTTCTQNNPAHYLNVFDHIIKVVEYLEDYRNSLSQEDFLMLRIVALLHDIGKPLSKTELKGVEHFRSHQSYSESLSRKILERLGYKKVYIDRLCKFIFLHDFSTSPTLEGVKKTSRLIGKEDVRLLYILQVCDMKAHSKDYAEKKVAILNSVIEILDNNLNNI